MNCSTNTTRRKSNPEPPDEDGRSAAGVNDMVWLEMISIRTAGMIETGKVFDICREILLLAAFEKLLKLTVYSNARYATDISIHLQWKSYPGRESAVGREVCAALKALGLVNHTLWIEQEDLSLALPGNWGSGGTSEE